MILKTCISRLAAPQPYPVASVSTSTAKKTEYGNVAEINGAQCQILF